MEDENFRLKCKWTADCIWFCKTTYLLLTWILIAVCNPANNGGVIEILCSRVLSYNYSGGGVTSKPNCLGSVFKGSPIASCSTRDCTECWAKIHFGTGVVIFKVCEDWVKVCHLWFTQFSLLTWCLFFAWMSHYFIIWSCTIEHETFVFNFFFFSITLNSYDSCR